MLFQNAEIENGAFGRFNLLGRYLEHAQGICDAIAKEKPLGGHSLAHSFLRSHMFRCSRWLLVWLTDNGQRVFDRGAQPIDVVLHLAVRLHHRERQLHRRRHGRLVQRLVEQVVHRVVEEDVRQDSRRERAGTLVALALARTKAPRL